MKDFATISNLKQKGPPKLLDRARIQEAMKRPKISLNELQLFCRDGRICPQDHSELHRAGLLGELAGKAMALRKKGRPF